MKQHMMKAAVFESPGRIVLVDKPVPEVGPLDALMRITTTTLCGTDVHILKGEYPVARGLTVGHEPVGVVARLGAAVHGLREGQRVIAGAITPSGWSNACLCGMGSQDGAGSEHGWKALGGWKLGGPSACARPSAPGSPAPASSSASTACPTACRWPAAWGPTTPSTAASSIRWPRSCG